MTHPSPIAAWKSAWLLAWSIILFPGITLGQDSYGRTWPTSTSSSPAIITSSNPTNTQSTGYQATGSFSRISPITLATPRNTANSMPATQQRYADSTFSRRAWGDDLAARPVLSTSSPLLNHDPATLSKYDQQRIESARQTARQLDQFSTAHDPPLAEFALRNAQLAAQWADLAAQINDVTARVDHAQRQLASTTRDFEDVSKKIDSYGLTPTIGQLLRQKREHLDAWQVHDSQTLFASEEIDRIRPQRLQLELIQYDGSDPEQQVNEVLGSQSQTNDPQRLQLTRLLQERYQWIQALTIGFDDYQERLRQLDSTIRSSQELTAKYRGLIQRHITWIRSDEPLGLTDLRNLKGGTAALFNSRRSADFGPTIQRKLDSNLFGAIGLAISFTVLMLIRWRAKTWLTGIGSRIRMRSATAENRKIVAGLLTTLVSLMFPAILYAISRWLGQGIVSEATLHASAAFLSAAWVAWAIEVPRQILRADGFLDKHLELELPQRDKMVRFLTIIGIALVVAAYTTTLMGLIDHAMWRGSVARIGFMGAMLLFAWAVHLALRPTNGYLQPLIVQCGGEILYRSRWLLYVVGLGFPLAMVVLSLLGYGFAAHAFIHRAIVTWCCVLTGLVLWSTVTVMADRLWDLLTGVQSTVQISGHHETDAAEFEAGAGVLGQHNLELKHQLAFLCQCSLVVGMVVALGLLWVDLFPNLRMGNPVLWEIASANATAMPVAGDITAETVPVSSQPVTLMHLGIALATLFVAFQLAKLLPAMFDALVLQRVSFDEAMEHLSLVIGRCLLFGVGCFIACRMLGVRWHTIQWLAVGLTIGLGFGLQDMVRNLFGGLIVLFEKPAKLGDLITVGDVTGRVSMQRLRTTVLADDEGREVIVPNQNFVKDEVTNWMGAGRLSVLAMEVSVTRERRPADLCRTLFELMREHPGVLLTPSPQATLVCVGKHSQRIELRAWIERTPKADRKREELLKAITTYLREERLLTKEQPPQPTLSLDVDPLADADSKPHRSWRKRSA